MTTKPSRMLDTVDNPQPDRDYTIRIDAPEFTCLCPLTGQPDFATVNVVYIPDRLCLELKSLKLYLWSYRNEGAFHEAVTNKILSEMVEASKPRFMRVSADFNVRGGVYTQVVVEHRAQNWVAATPVLLPE
ncbi:MAG: NADPH-dependent 7-cyano-7-deazaguanine reductase QueF [Gammaproteobacteria bacterium]|nr:NADPH-dependent 7-cyano-7-deazaguanine reductase QueF [Gammaproteobacteria bacterium]